MRVEPLRMGWGLENEVVLSPLDLLQCPTQNLDAFPASEEHHARTFHAIFFTAFTAYDFTIWHALRLRVLEARCQILRLRNHPFYPCYYTIAQACQDTLGLTDTENNIVRCLAIIHGNTDRSSNG